jgi:hypothetical protein
MMPVPTVRATWGAEEQEGDEVEERRPRHCMVRPQNPRRHDGRDRVRRIMQAVEEIEQERDDDQAEQQGQSELYGVHG